MFMVVLAADRVTKLIITETFALGESVEVAKYFHWTFIMNDGAAFGILQGSRWLFVIFAVVVLAGIICFRKDILEQDWLTQSGVACFAAGTVGNLIDRALFGGVIDFIDFRVWPVFNVADIAVCLGVALLMWSIIWTEQLKKN